MHGSLAQVLPYRVRLAILRACTLLRGPRKHLYCVGLPKTGTHSVAGLFKSSFHAAHEPRYRQLIEPLRAKSVDELECDQFHRLMVERRFRLWLDLESCHVLGQFAPRLAALFPDAKFIMTVREPKSWLDSMIDDQFFHLDDRGYRPWWPIYDCYFGARPQVFEDCEAELQSANLYALRSYLRYYRRTQERILDAIPQHRLLVVETRQLADRSDEIAKFSGVSLGALDVGKSHSYQRPQKSGILSRMDATFVQNCVDEEAGDIKSQLADMARVEWK